jgi:AraC family transcriptional regulator
MLLTYCNDGKRTYAADHPSKHYSYPHWRKEWAFQFTLSGSCIRINRENNVTHEDPVTGPVVSVSGPDCIHGWRAKTNDSCTVLIFHFDDADYNLRHVIGNTGYRLAAFPAKDIPQIQELFDRCIQARRKHDFSSPIIYHIVSLELTAYFLGLLPRTEVSGGGDFGENKVIEALAWYKVNLSRGPHIEEVAHAVHLSSTHLRRLFHKVWNMSPQQAFTRAQFERARELMLDHTIALERIAESAGFGSASAFSRAFKAEFKMSPKTYRLNLQAQHVPTTSHPVAKVATSEKGR